MCNIFPNHYVLCPNHLSNSCWYSVNIVIYIIFLLIGMQLEKMFQILNLNV